MRCVLDILGLNGIGLYGHNHRPAYLHGKGHFNARPIPPPDRMMELQVAKEILEEVFKTTPSDVEDMIRQRMLDR